MKSIASSVRIEALLAVILWGAIYPAAKMALHEIPVIDFIYLRILLAAGILFILADPFNAFMPSFVLWPTVAVAGITQIASQTLLHAGIRYTTAGIAAILLATSPLFSGAWVALSGRARLVRRQWCGLLLGLLGIIFVIGPGAVTLDLTHVIGDVLSLGAAAVWVFYSISIASLAGSLGAMRARAWSMIIA